MQVTSAPSAAQVEEIAAADGDPVLRNLRITQGYSDLSAAMSALLGAGNGTWCVFGTWASKTAGGFIRGDELPAAARRTVASTPTIRQHATVLQRAAHAAGAAVAPLEMAADLAGRLAADVSLYIMQGNKVVFEEMGGAYARFLEAAGTDGGSGERVDALLASLEPGEVQPDAVTVDWATRTVTTQRRGGQSLLREMLHQYRLAMEEPDAGKRAQLVLYANALGGIHEQTRLQAYVAESLDVPVDDFLREALHRGVGDGGTDQVARHAAHAAVDRLVHPLADGVRRAWESCATKAMMTMHLPDGTLRLGLDVPAPPGQPLFPPQLATIDLPALREVLAQYGALSPRARLALGGLLAGVERRAGRLLGRPPQRRALGSAAVDWASLSERMRYILELFRSRQQDAVLRSRPFTDDQAAAIAKGAVPAGPL